MGNDAAKTTETVFCMYFPTVRIREALGECYEDCVFENHISVQRSIVHNGLPLSAEQLLQLLVERRMTDERDEHRDHHLK